MTAPEGTPPPEPSVPHTHREPSYRMTWSVEQPLAETFEFAALAEVQQLVLIGSKHARSAA